MALKISQGTAWVLGVTGAIVIHTGVYLAVKLKAQQLDHEEAAAMNREVQEVEREENSAGGLGDGEKAKEPASAAKPSDSTKELAKPDEHQTTANLKEEKKATEVNESSKEKNLRDDSHAEPKTLENEKQGEHQIANDEKKGRKRTREDNKTPEHEVHWGYDEKTGPAQWGKLSSANFLCDEGKEQSPIDIYGVKKQSGLPELKLNYKAGYVAWFNNGHSLEGDVPEGNILTIDGHDYELKQFHFHTPSEHKEDGIAYPMEVHLVHKDEHGAIAVIGIFIEEGERNKLFDTLWQTLPQPGPAPKLQVRFDITKVVPPKAGYYHYMGSLTTPPCTEGVSWYVLSKPIYFSGRQIADFEHIFQRNARPPQVLNERVIQAK